MDEDRGYRPPWLGLEVRHLVALAAIEREGSFSAAADELGYVQSAISQQIVRLEHIVGTRLISRERGRRAVTLTPAGALLAAHAHSLLGELHSARRSLAALDDARNVMRVGIAPGIAGWLMVRLIRRLQAHGLRSAFNFIEASDPATVVAGVDGGEFEAGLGAPPRAGHEHHVRVLVQDRYVAVLPAGSAAADRGEPMDARALADRPFMLPVTSWEFDPAESQLQACGFDVTAALRAPVGAALQAFAAAGHGAAIMPSLTVDEDDPAITVLPLADVEAHRVVTLFWRRDRHAEGLERLADVLAMSVRRLRSRALDASA